MTATLCYMDLSGIVANHSGLRPCGDTNDAVQNCCGQDDDCIGNNICRRSQAFGRGTYLAGCTDPKYSASTCSRQCAQYQTADIVHNRTTDQWSCCWNDGVLDCSNPGNDTFALGSASQSQTLVSSASTVTPTASSTSAPDGGAQQQVSQSSSNLSTGAKAGIGIAFAVLGLGLLLAVLVIWRLSRRKNQVQTQDDVVKQIPPGYAPPTSTYPQLKVEMDPQHESELDGRGVSELNAHQGSRGGW